MLYAARRHNWQTEPTPSRWMISQVTFDPVLAGEPSWSPDGRFLAYSSDRNGNFDIWVKPLGEGEPVQVTKSGAHDWQPDWSPEGTRLAFRSERDGGGLFEPSVLERGANAKCRLSLPTALVTGRFTDFCSTAHFSRSSPIYLSSIWSRWTGNRRAKCCLVYWLTGQGNGPNCARHGIRMVSGLLCEQRLQMD